MHNLHNIAPGVGMPPRAFISALLLVGGIASLRPVLSGGAIRDWLNGKPIKDLDIFLPYDAGLYEDMLYEMRAFHGWTAQAQITPSCEGLNEVVATTAFSREGEIDINLIYLDRAVSCDALAVAERNDFGICQVSACLDDDDRLIFSYTDAFVSDQLGRTFTLIRKGDEARSMRRFERLSEKYPEHRLVTPFV